MTQTFLPQGVLNDARHIARNLVKAYHLPQAEIDDILQKMFLALHSALPRFRGMRPGTAITATPWNSNGCQNGL